MAKHGLQRVLSGGFVIAASVGATIGLGILRTPGEVAAAMPDPMTYLALWFGGGLFVLLSLSVVSEMLGLTPRSGGNYVLVNRAFGSFPGFVVGWADWIGTCATRSLMAVVSMEYLALLVPEAREYALVGALAIPSLFALLQLRGVLFAGLIQKITASAGALIIMGVTAVLVYGGIEMDAVPLYADTTSIPYAFDVKVFALAVSSIIFTYDGWFAICYLNGEIKTPPRHAIMNNFKGALTVMALYMMVNAALVFGVPLQVLQGHDLALAGAVEFVLGEQGAMFIIIGALIILTGHQNWGFMITARILYALSVDGVGNENAKKVNDSGTPSVAVLFSWAMITALILLGGFEFLLSLVAILLMLGYATIMAGVMWLRIKEPETYRPYRSFGYPYVAGLVTLCWFALMIFIIIIEPLSAIYGLGFIVLAVPAFLWLRSIHRRALDEQKLGSEL